MPPLYAGSFEGSGEPDFRELAAAEIFNKGESAEAALEALGCPNEHPEEFSDRPSILTWPKAQEPTNTGKSLLPVCTYNCCNWMV
jgi:hypothetical protein